MNNQTLTIEEMEKLYQEALKMEMKMNLTCSMYCGDGSGKPVKIHQPICPFYGLEISCGRV